MATQHTTVSVHIELAQPTANNRIAEGYLAFKGGPLDGCKISGFTVWQKRDGGERVTFPAMPTSPIIHGEAVGSHRFDN